MGKQFSLANCLWTYNFCVRGRFPSTVKTSAIKRSEVTPAKGSITSGQLSPPGTDSLAPQCQQEVDLVSLCKCACLFMYLWIIATWQSGACCNLFVLSVVIFPMMIESFSKTIFCSANPSNNSPQRSWGRSHGVPYIWVSYQDIVSDPYKIAVLGMFW